MTQDDVAQDAPFRSRRGRAMALTMAGISLVLFAVLALLIHGWGPGDRLLMFGLGLALSAFLARYAAISAVPLPEGLRVRNLFLSRTVTWDEVEDVSFPEGDPWARLDLSDGDELAVMAIQRADGELGRAEALRLARLVLTHKAD